MPTMADLGAHKGGIESVRQQGGRVGSELSLLSFSLSLGHLQLRSSSQLVACACCVPLSFQALFRTRAPPAARSG